MNAERRTPLQWALILIAVAGLVVDAIVHYDLASNFAEVKTDTLSQADIFRVESTVALIVAAALLFVPRRITALIVFAVAASAVAAVVVYRYVDVGTIGPIPNMYDPYWEPTGKWLSAVAEVVAALASAALVGLLTPSRQRANAAADA
jgi:glucan phosphoethanolaminetransferase (alkaline phosphatase superfamily)